MAEQYEARISSKDPLGQFSTILSESPRNLNNFEDLDDDFLDVYHLGPRQRAMNLIKKYQNKLNDIFNSFPLWKKVIFIFMGGIIIVLSIIIIIFHNKILSIMVKVSNDLNERWYTSLIFILLIFISSFPPLVGFSLLSTCAGLVYGITFKGWIILSLGYISGSITSFIVMKSFLHEYTEKMIRLNTKLNALASVLEDNNSYWILALVKLCPFPYSLTNGVIASIYGVSLRNFILANIITTPKLIMYLFIGSRLRKIGESDSGVTRMINLVSISVALFLMGLTTSILYLKTKSRYLELQSEGLSTLE